MNKLNTKELVNKYGFKFTKSLGQNFLTDQSVLDDIVNSAKLTKDDVVIEIGPGVGTLTKELLEKAKKVYSIELDSSLVPILQEELKEYDNFTLINKDALKVDFNELIKDEKVKFVANLPYYVTTPIIAKILTEGYNFDSLTIMIQKEVAERIGAEPGTKEYGSLSILVQYYCDVEIVRYVSSNAFIPQPKVDSIVIKLLKLDKPRTEMKDYTLFMKIVRQSFNMRRKTLRNGIKSMKILSGEMIDKAFENAGIDGGRRGETLSIEEFAQLSDAILDLL
ncbi:16S rRNA (adenine(1518)-N(6)/adenine(1519)-N(6))-dimethyltransferase RsmA [Clostridium grantii]|uniref:Ribosomal RNA small subunit methyltransferase A n=1 Tax=Clostridium grantii DSM 8605 TaxID=1121316 RepID=A0A1M5XU34_9CLOT|nr:16S rRNA (adenine(1518)-N(6)/adenine(1519)-N(6))-dimethyltransferase RsmA [Clostridium grantii]SHI03335.1 dimethyladenosine transferase [Clostridium grantii DSM 8605]